MNHYCNPHPMGAGNAGIFIRTSPLPPSRAVGMPITDGDRASLPSERGGVARDAGWSWPPDKCAGPEMLMLLAWQPLRNGRYRSARPPARRIIEFFKEAFDIIRPPCQKTTKGRKIFGEQPCSCRKRPITCRAPFIYSQCAVFKILLYNFSTNEETFWMHFVPFACKLSLMGGWPWTEMVVWLQEDRPWAFFHPSTHFLSICATMLF